MSARDAYHDQVRNALIKDGWTITHDPLRLNWGGKDLYVDLGAERLLAAEKAGLRIAVEIKGFAGKSSVEDLEEALGQYLLYLAVLSERDPARTLFLAVPADAASDTFDEALGELLIRKYSLRIVAFDPNSEEVVRWIP